MPVTLARSMDAVSICTCSLPTASLPRHLPLTLSALPGSGGPGPPAGLQPPPSARRALPGPSRGTEPEGGAGAPGRDPTPGEPDPAGAVCAQVRSGTPCPKRSPNAWSVGNTVWHSAPWLVSLQYQFFLFTRPKKPVTKTNKHTPHPLRDVTHMCLLLDLDAGRTSLQCRKSNTTIKGSICLQLQH